MPREFSRSQRLGAQMQRTLSELLHFETKDPGLADVSLTNVELSKDLSIAKIYFSLLNPDADPAPAQEGLKRASGFLRSKLGSAMLMRHVPELRFVHDDSIAHAAKISRLIDDANDASRQS
ncbi:MAG: 30S ribosome-binding factor RbfA [Proteobacteria bacterium]|jgi:ribosome-binding factor A|nr:30S ribosome-binding factor RbfA [Pseudomonadota bacterium]MDA0994329.1 30S ribosome-binding factor RbfA [Pseudomonadota bacterium]